MVQLPEVTPRVRADGGANGTDAVHCAYPQDDLYKAFNQDLQTKAPAAFAFLSAMSVDQRRSERRRPGINDGHGPARTRRRKWIDANPTVWQPWVDAGLAQRSRRNGTQRVAARGGRPKAARPLASC